MENETHNEASILQRETTNEHLDSLSKTAEAQLLKQDETATAVNELNSPLEAILLETNKVSEKLDEVTRAIKEIPEIEIPESKDFPEYPTKMEMEIKGISVLTLKGDKGDKPTDEEITSLIKPLIPVVKNGKDYILTEKDKKEIALSIKVPIVEKVIEKTETIVEKPIVTNEIKEVAITDTPNQIAEKLNTLSKVIDWKTIKNAPEIKGGAGGLSTVSVDGVTVFGNGLPDNPLRSTGGMTNPMTSLGDTIYGGASGEPERLEIGPEGTVLTSISGIPSWEYPESTGLLVYMFANSASDIGGYYDAVSLPSYVVGSQGDISTAGVSTTPTLLGSFATELGYPGVVNIPEGVWHIHYETEKVAGANNYYTYATVYKRSAGGSETLLFTSDNSTQTAQNTVIQQTVTIPVSTITTLLTTDRIVVKVYGVMLSSTATIHLYFDDNTDARIEMPSVSVDASNFVPYTGATTNVNLGSFDLSVADEAYGAGWNGSLEVPTKNAVYDKIQTIASGGITRTITSISSPTTAGATASTDYVYIVTGTTTLTLPTAIGNSNLYSIKNAGVNTVTVAFTGGQTGDGSSTLTLTPNTSLTLVSDNSNYYII